MFFRSIISALVGMISAISGIMSDKPYLNNCGWFLLGSCLTTIAFVTFAELYWRREDEQANR